MGSRVMVAAAFGLGFQRGPERELHIKGGTTTRLRGVSSRGCCVWLGLEVKAVCVASSDHCFSREHVSLYSDGASFGGPLPPYVSLTGLWWTLGWGSGAATGPRLAVMAEGLSSVTASMQARVVGTTGSRPEGLVFSCEDDKSYLT